jgi:hypothetical protein
VPPGSGSGGRAWAAGARPWRTRRSGEEADERHLLLGSRSCLAARRRVVKLPPEPLRPPALPHAHPLALHGGLLALLGRMSRAPPTSRSRHRAGTPRRAGSVRDVGSRSLSVSASAVRTLITLPKTGAYGAYLTAYLDGPNKRPRPPQYGAQYAHVRARTRPPQKGVNPWRITLLIWPGI